MGILQRKSQIIIVTVGCLLMLSQTTILAQDGVTTQDVGNPGADGFECVKPLVCPTPAAIRYDVDLGAMDTVETGIQGTRTFFEGTMSQTLALSQSMSTLVVSPDVITASTVPADYAPALPRAVAQVGWQFESMGSDLQRRYSVAEWSKLFIGIVAIPIKFVKGIFVLGRYLGPLGLFLAWLFVMLPIVMWMKFANFVKNTIIKIFNLIVELIRIIGDIWDIFPFA